MLSLRSSAFALSFALLLVMTMLPASPAAAQPSPTDIDFVTIGAPGNRGYDGVDFNGEVTGKGATDYEYRMGRTEVTTAQILEFINTFKARADSVPDSVMPIPRLWGATQDFTYTGPGTRYRLVNDANAGRFPVGGITWRVSAMFTNWLSHDKSSAISAYQNGAYDVSTFRDVNNNPFVWTDQEAHNPNARFWIPTADELIKAAYFDPANGGRWWRYQNGTDNTPLYGPPGMGEANANFQIGVFGEYRIPTGSYPSVQSPWGLLDSAGSVTEWTESIQVLGARRYRQIKGSYAGGLGSFGLDDIAYGFGDEHPGSDAYFMGLRIASAVPGPAVFVIFGASVPLFNRRRRQCSCANALIRRCSPV